MLRSSVAYACHVMAVLISLLLTLRDGVRSRTSLQLEVLALRHQLHVLKRTPARGLRLTRFDRLLWVWLSRVWDQWRATHVLDVSLFADTAAGNCALRRSRHSATSVPAGSLRR